MSFAGGEISVNLTAGLLFAAAAAVRGFIADVVAVCDEITAVVCANEACLSSSFSRSSFSLCRQS